MEETHDLGPNLPHGNNMNDDTKFVSAVDG